MAEYFDDTTRYIAEVSRTCYGDTGEDGEMLRVVERELTAVLLEIAGEEPRAFLPEIGHRIADDEPGYEGIEP
jgi:hypothetical protein